jgi:small conductance mechanosensitive channel
MDELDLTVDIGAAFAAAQAKVVAWIEGLVGALPNFIAALLVLLAFWLIARVVRRVTHRIMARVSDHPAFTDLVTNLVFLAILAVGTFLALGVLRLDKTVTSLLAGAGILGLALGFAFQSTAENFVAGAIMAFRRPFRIGDIIEVADHTGVVEHLAMRATVLRTFDGRQVLIPNGKVFNNPIVNHTDRLLRRIDIEIGVTYDADLPRVQHVTTEAISAVEARQDDMPAETFFTGFGDSSINLVARFWIPFHRQTDYFAARSDAIVRIKAAYDANDITIPFPIRTLDFGPVGGITLEEVWDRRSPR